MNGALLQASLLAVGLSASGSAQASVDEACLSVGFVDLGWTDIELATTTARQILERLGYETSSDLLALGITYEALRNDEMDVFMGNWQPAQDVEFAQYYEEGWVEVLGVNLEGAKYTLAVPNYVADAGVRSFTDLAAHAEEFDSSIHAIEPGSNEQLLQMIAADRYGLGDWELIETSEQAMLAAVDGAIEDGKWIVFLGWEPHPMNETIEMTYLEGGDETMGPNFGGSTVRTIARPGFNEDCPNAAKFMSQLNFDLDYENAGMGMILDEDVSVDDTAMEMMRQHPERVAQWLEGVTTREGEPALPVIEAMLAEGQ
ncbi:MAG TPA: glycine betaine ABC transporter substrate-binding protein [Rubellimicrobium sp.]|nr:glycine betaine ABC transporter substrate-binding protein [Rubellimicrobium sp.]